MALSTHRGGAADKAGAAHEALWGVRAILQVLTGEALSIRIEEPGVDGAEFYLQRESHREYWQAKRQITGPGPRLPFDKAKLDGLRCYGALALPPPEPLRADLGVSAPELA